MWLPLGMSWGQGAGSACTHTPSPARKAGPAVQGYLRTLAAALTVYAASTLLIAVWAFAGATVLPRAKSSWRQAPVPGTAPSILLKAFVGADGIWYVGIAREGYRYRPDQWPYPGNSACVYFPAYPLAGRCLAALLGIPPIAALLLLSHASLYVFLVLLWRYAETAFGTDDAIPAYAISAFALFPTTIFCRMAYTESMFLALGITMLLLARRNTTGSLFWAALVAGAATATRPTGLALAPAVVLAGLRHCDSWAAAARRILWVLPLSTWGIAMYASYLAITQGDGLVFARAQDYFSPRPHPPLLEKLLALATWEPIWATYVPSSPSFWGHQAMDPPMAILSLQFANPVFFLVALILLVVGAIKRWCTLEEIVLGLGLLLIPYVTRSYEACMVHGRYAMVAIPQYLVLANILARSPRWVAWAVLTGCATLLGGYNGMAAAGYPFL